MEHTDVRTIAVIGAGNMGHGIAEVAALAGYDVHLRDITEEFVENGYEQIEWSVTKMVEQDRLTDAEGDATLERIETFVDLEAALRSVEFIIEVVPEQMEIKTDVYADLEEHAPDDAIFASNTSTFPITTLAESTDRPEQFCGMHFFNPPVRMPLVEVIAGKHTSEETLALTEEVATEFGKTPVRVRKDVPGFIVNRVLVPMLNEAAWLVETGEATIAEVDSTAKYSLELPMGCFELTDQIGIDVALHVIEYMHESLGPAYKPCPLLSEVVDAGTHGKKTGEGFYNYEDGEATVPDDQHRTDVEEQLVGVAVNEVAKLVAADVADPAAIDEAVQLGAGFPNGPTELGADHGYERLVTVLSERAEQTGSPRYEPSAQLRDWAADGGPDER